MSTLRRSLAILLTPLLFLASASSYAETKTLVITGSSTWQPFSFINSLGQPDGIMVDFWRLYAEKNDVAVEFRLKPWSESLDFVGEQAGVIHGGLGYTSERAKRLAFSSVLPLRDYDVNLFVQKDLPFEDISALESAIIGSVKDSTKHAFLQSRVAAENIRVFPTFGSLNEAAYRGEIDVFIDDLSTALYDMRHSGNSGLFTPRQKLYSFPLHFAVSKSSQEMVADVERGLARISQEEINTLYEKWLPHNKLHSTLPWLNKTAQYAIFAAFLVLLTTGLFLYHRLLKNRTEELKHAVQALLDSEKKLECASQLDPLTGSKNRHHFFAAISERRFSPAPYVVAMLDIDNLKSINHQFGQDVGDMAIKHVATHLKLQLSSQTLFARIGDDEFAILFELSDSSQAQRKLVQLQKSMQLSALYIDQQQVPVTFTYGIASCPYDTEQGDELVRIAHDRLRQQKSNSANAPQDDDYTSSAVNVRRWA